MGWQNLVTVLQCILETGTIDLFRKWFFLSSIVLSILEKKKRKANLTLLWLFHGKWV